MFKRYFIALRKAPFRPAKWPILGCEMVLFSLWCGLNRTAKWAISESKKSIFGLWYGVYHKTMQAEMGLIMYVLTFLYISFAKIFCQNLVKKNCKFVAWVYSVYAGICHKKKYGECVVRLRGWIICMDARTYYYANKYTLLCGLICCIVWAGTLYNVSRCNKSYR